jgi:hypothetical protein
MVSMSLRWVSVKLCAKTAVGALHKASASTAAAKGRKERIG